MRLSTTDFGNTWQSIAGNLPKGEVVRTITEDVKNADVLYSAPKPAVGLDESREAVDARQGEPADRADLRDHAAPARQRHDPRPRTAARSGFSTISTPFQQWSKAETTDAFVFEPAPAVAFNQANDQMKSFEGDRVSSGRTRRRARRCSIGCERRREGRQSRRSATRRTPSCASCPATRSRIATRPDSTRCSGICGISRLRRCAISRQRRRVAAEAAALAAAATTVRSSCRAPTAPRSPSTGAMRTSSTSCVTGDPAIQITDADRSRGMTRRWRSTSCRRRPTTSPTRSTRRGRTFSRSSSRRRARTLPPAVKTQLESVRKELEAVRVVSVLAVAGRGRRWRFRRRQSERARPHRSAQRRHHGSTSLPTEVQMRQKQEIEAAWPKLAAEANAAMAKLPGWRRTSWQRCSHRARPLNSNGRLASARADRRAPSVREGRFADGSV